MKKIRLLRAKTVSALSANISANLSRYRAGTFDFLETDQSTFIEIESTFDEEKLSGITCSSTDTEEVKCCTEIYQAMNAVEPYLARDARLWIYLTHTFMLPYSRARWPIPDDDEKAVSHIKTHFFASSGRGIERDNAASRLWWMASLCNRVDGIEFEDALASFLHQSDVRASIIERPTTSQSVPLFSALIRRLDRSLKTDKELYERKKFRALMKQLNLRGGVTLLGALPTNELEKILDECVA